MWQLKQVTRAPFIPHRTCSRSSKHLCGELLACQSQDWFSASFAAAVVVTLLRACWDGRLINTQEHGGHNGSVGTWKQYCDGDSCWFILPNADWSFESLTSGYFSSLSGLSLVEGRCFVLLLACCTTPNRLGHQCYRFCHLSQLFPAFFLKCSGGCLKALLDILVLASRDEQEVKGRPIHRGFGFGECLSHRGHGGRARLSYTDSVK